jgi:hypothetical protein
MKVFGIVGAIVLIGSFGCSSQENEANTTCLSGGETYLVSYTEMASGTCGSIPSVIINVNPDGTIELPTGESCASSVVQGCQVQNTDCTWSLNGYNYAMTSDVTFDYTSGSGLVSLSTDSCSST